MKRMRYRASMITVVLAVATIAQAAPLASVTGLAFTPDGQALLVAGAHGVAVLGSPGPARGLDAPHEVIGFAATETALYSSGRLGLMRAAHGMPVWKPLALEGEASFRTIAAGFRTNALYVLADVPNEAMRAPGLYWTRDEGKTWRRTTAQGLKGNVLDLAAHPLRGTVIAAATSTGLFISHDAGNHFRRIYGKAVTAAAFDESGERLFAVTAEESELLSIALAGGARTSAKLPPIGIDIVTHIAPSPVDARTLAFATERRNVFITEDAGASWKQIARNGNPP